MSSLPAHRERSGARGGFYDSGNVPPDYSEDSSAETVDTRISSMYVYEAETTIMADAIPTERDYLTYYMIEGGSNWKAMTEYLKNPQNSPGVKGYDFGVLRDSIGKTVHLHGMRNYSDN